MPRIVPVSSSWNVSPVIDPEISIALLVLRSGILSPPVGTIMKVIISILGKMIIFFLMIDMASHTLVLVSSCLGAGVIISPTVTPSYPYLAVMGRGSLIWIPKGFDSIIIDLLVKSGCLDVKMVDVAGLRVDLTIPDSICPINTARGG